MSTEIATRGGGTPAVPQGARALGQRVKPIIRLGMGYKDPERGFPRKTDHFTVRGDERAIEKFKAVYGEAPKAVKIMVPAELSLALDISYRSFVGGGDADGGRPLALGMTNFAPLGFVGGPDVLRVWKQDGSYAEVETLGLDELGKPLDEIAKDLNIEVYATFTFTIPEVLGWGSFCAITSKGKQSADNLVYKLAQIYGAFGNKAPFAFSREEPPMLVLKPSTAMLRFEDKDGAKWGKTAIFVLDIVIPEAFDTMVDRLADRQRAIAPAGPAATLYPPELSAAQEEVSARAENGEAQAAEEVSDSDSLRSEAQGPTSAAAPAEPEPEGEVEEAQFSVPGDVATDSPEIVAANEAAELTFESGKYKGKTLREIADDGDEGQSYIGWVLRNWKTEAFRLKVLAFARVYVPDVYEAATAEKEASS